MNLADSAAALPVSDAMGMTNLIRAECGLRSRLGYQDWCTGINSSGQVRTIIPYTGSSKSGSGDKLFAAASDGIYDVTTSSASPTRVYTWAASDSLSGWCSFTSFTTSAGKFLALCDETNGYILYTESTDTWAAVAAGSGAGQIDGVDPANFVHVASWKRRLWFTEASSGRAWYLPIGQIAGTVTSFDFGTKFKAGGHLVGILDWTADGGFGIDDYLVALSSAGDVAIYQGTDPSSANTFGMRGVWFAGQFPAGRRIATDIGGDLLLLTSLGVLPLSRLVQAGEKLDPSIYASRKIQPALNSAMAATGTQRGWDIRLQPQDASLLVLMPTLTGQPVQQWAMSIAAKGWSLYSGLPAVCGDTWNGVWYFGTSDGKVCKNTGYVDGMARDGTGWTAIVWSYLSSFQDFGAARDKRVQFIKPSIITSGENPACTARARYDFDINALETSTYVAAGASGAAWDSATWDVSSWASGVGTSGDWSGCTGIGKYVAIAVNGNSTSRTVLVGASVTWDVGGVL